MSRSESQSDLKRENASDLSGTAYRHRRACGDPVILRSGMTLLELLIVIGVMVILLGLALPIMKTGLQGRQTREASRQLSTYLELAKAIAAETGRPAGLKLVTQTLPEDTTGVVRFATELYITETPLPYTGDITHARVKVMAIDTTTTPNLALLEFETPAYNGSVSFLNVGIGDRIRLDYKGPLYEIVKIVPPNTESITPTSQFYISGSPLPPEPPTLPQILAYPYQIYRQPAESSSMPLELATGAVVDLKNSGFGLLGLQFAASDPTSSGSVNIIFNPSGSLSHVIIDNTRWEQTDTIHLLVGRVDHLIPEDINDPDGNLADPEARWVSIGHQAGKVTVAENGWDESRPTLDVCREFAQSAQSMGGR